MSPLIRSLIEKAGYANGYENVRESTAERVVLFSARHRSDVRIVPSGPDSDSWRVEFASGPPAGELARSFPLSSEGWIEA